MSGERIRAMKQIDAYRCEMGLEKRCRCRCEGLCHGKKRISMQVCVDDPHAVAFFCSQCGNGYGAATAYPPLHQPANPDPDRRQLKLLEVEGKDAIADTNHRRAAEPKDHGRKRRGEAVRGAKRKAADSSGKRNRGRVASLRKRK